MTDGRLGPVQHQLHAVGLGERDAALQAGDATHLDDIWLHHPHPGIDQVGHACKRVGLLAGGDGDVELARHLAQLLGMVVDDGVIERIKRTLQNAAAPPTSDYPVGRKGWFACSRWRRLPLLAQSGNSMVAS